MPCIFDIIDELRLVDWQTIAIYTCSNPLNLTYSSCRTIDFPITDHISHTVTYSVTTAGGHVSQINLIIQVECDLTTTTLINRDMTKKVLL